MSSNNHSVEEVAAQEAVSWLSTYSVLGYHSKIQDGFDIALKEFDVKADSDFTFAEEPRRANLRSIDWYGGSTPYVEASSDECVTFKMTVSAEVEFTTRFDFFETISSSEEEMLLNFRILKTKRSFKFPIRMTSALTVNDNVGPDIRYFEVTRPALTALYGNIHPFDEYVQKRT